MSQDDMAQNQQQAIDSEEYQLSSRPSRKHSNDEEEEQESQGYEEEEEDVPLSLTRSNATVGRRPFAAKEPFYGKGFSQSEEEDPSDSDDFKDLAWFFDHFYPELERTNRIAWCRTYANMLAAMLPKNRPKTYKKRKTNENPSF